MKVQIVSQTDTGSSNAIVINTNTNPCNIGFGVIVDGTVDYTVEHTFDDPSSDLNDGATWFPHPTVFELAVNADGNYAFPITGVRLTVNSGGGTATLKLVQAGIA
jgi:archaellum component FlaF (FlaF/FlaG flagellin family)